MAEGFEGLAVWRKAHELMLFVHRQILPVLPREEKWCLADQIRRASKSVAANIAEGYGRFYYQDNIRFCYNARGSLVETINHLIAARELDYISIDLYQEGRQLADDVYRLINGYIAYLKKSKQGANEPGANVVAHESLEEYVVPSDELTS
jgi:four helix bundle protein